MLIIMFTNTMFEDTDKMNQVLFDLLDELINKNESLESLDDKDDWTVDDFLIATIQFVDFIFNAKVDFVINHRL